MNYKINKPCSEDWESMKIAIHSRFCANCEKNVMDFTQMDKKEIIDILENSMGEKICGRAYPYQLDFKPGDFLPSINSYAPNKIKSQYSPKILVLGAIIISSCNSPDQMDNQQKTPPTSISQKTDSTFGSSENSEIKNLDSVSKINSKNTQSTKACSQKSAEEDSLQLKTLPQVNPKIDPPEVLMGIVVKVPKYDKRTVLSYTEVDVPPEFPGGLDSLSSFLRNTIKYPREEIKNKTEGKIFLSFILSKTGEIDSITILRSLGSESHFTDEAIRVVKLIPKWKPAEHQGEKVEVEFIIPINFKL